MTRTTSAIEAYNGVLGRTLPKSGNFFKFTKTIQDEEFMKSRDFEILVESGGTVGTKIRRKHSVERANKIMEASELLERGSITAMAFLNRMVYPKNNICTDMEPIDDIFQEYPDCVNDEEKISSDEEWPAIETVAQRDNNMCVVCFNNRPNIVLLPCKHLQICSECNLKLQAKGLAAKTNAYICPVCRQEVEDTIQVFLEA